MDSCKFISVKSLSEATGFTEVQIYKALQKRETNGLNPGIFQEHPKARIFINQRFFEVWAESKGLTNGCKRKPKASVVVSSDKYEELQKKQCKLKIKNAKAKEIIDAYRIPQLDNQQNGKNFVGRILSRIWRY